MRFLFVGKAITARVSRRARYYSQSSGSSRRTIHSKLSMPSGRMATTIGLTAAILLLAGCGSSASFQSEAQITASLHEVQAYPSDSFVDSVGVVTHLTYTDTNYYLEWPTVFNDLQDLGVRHLRDGYYDWSPGALFYSEHRQLASAGIKTNYVIPFDTLTTPASVASVASQALDMEAVEAPNECDVAGDCGATQAQGMANMLSFLSTVQESGEAGSVPVFGPSFAAYTSYSQVGNLASRMNYNNLHVYFGGRNPGSSGWGGADAEGNAYGSIPFWLNMASEDAPNLPVMITESGYMMFPEAQQYAIPPATGASSIPRTLLLAYTHGVKRTYLYELLDEVSSPGYGLIDGNMNPKPAFRAVQNLIANLWDEGASFTPGKLSCSLTGGGSTLQQALFQKRDGSFWLVLWLEQSSYDEVNLKQAPVTPQTVTLKLGGNSTVANIGTIETSGNMIWRSTNPPASTVAIPVSDLVTIVKILPSN